MKTLKTIQRAAIAFAATTLGIACAYQQTADQNGVYKVGGELTPPAVIAKSDPEYTEEARKAGIDGTVLLAVVVGTDGLAHDINVLKGIGSGLDEKAVEAVQTWRFRPGTKDGEAVKVRAQIEVNFRLLKKQ
jgi:TonB family protein